MPWHTLSAAEAAERLEVDVHSGLDTEAAIERLARHGLNALPEAKRRSAFAMFFSQFTEFMVLVLLAAAVVSGLVGDAVDTVAILVIILLNAVIGFAQEYRAEQAMDALRRLAAPSARVRRDGAIGTLPAEQLVPGDGVLLEAGALVPADLRLIEAARLRIAEAAPTGESVPADKTARALGDASAGIADRRNMVYRGTVTAYGRGVGIVVATGLDTELGRLARLLAQEETGRTPLQARPAQFGQRLSLAVLGVCAVIFAAGLARGEPMVLMLLTAVSLAVAAIPEALPAVVAIALALGARRMARRHALVRRLPAVEALGSVMVICSDKTGTLTQNRMRVEQFWVHGDLHPADRLAPVDDATPQTDGTAAGEPTEAALLEAALAAGLDWGSLARSRPRVAELPFDSDRKRMATLHQEGTAVVGYIKGAPESVLSRCHRQMGAGGAEALDAEAASAAAEEMAAAGLRVLAFALRRFDALPARHDDAEEELLFIGLVGLMDPPRREAAHAVAECVSAGIVPVMITGDHPTTARAITERLGILAPGAVVVTGAQLARMGDAELAQRVHEVRVYARVDPEQKIRIVGTDVAREAADMVLLDDNFATIVHAMREGRRFFDNIRKFIRYAMTGNAGEIWTIFLAPRLGLPTPRCCRSTFRGSTWRPTACRAWR